MENASLHTNIIRFLLNLFSRNILVTVVVYSCWVAIINYNYWFSWHVILCTVGIFPLMSESLMLFASDEVWSQNLTRREKYCIHGIIITLGTILVSVGSIITFYYLTEGYHLYTIHGITGLISMILFIVSLFLGLVTNYSQKFKKYVRPLICKTVHNYVGLVAYIIGVISLCYSFYTNWFIFYTSEESRLAALIATILATLWTLNSALISAYNQMANFLAE